MPKDLREISVVNPFATLLALYEMLARIIRGDAESRSQISRKVTHGASSSSGVTLPSLGGMVEVVVATAIFRQARLSDPPHCPFQRPSSQKHLERPHLVGGEGTPGVSVAASGTVATAGLFGAEL
jgi:hypothetical protein